MTHTLFRGAKVALKQALRRHVRESGERSRRSFLGQVSTRYTAPRCEPVFRTIAVIFQGTFVTINQTSTRLSALPVSLSIMPVQLVPVRRVQSYPAGFVGPRGNTLPARRDAFQIGGVTGNVAKVAGKQPPAIHVWVSAWRAPVFRKPEGPLYVGLRKGALPEDQVDTG